MLRYCLLLKSLLAIYKIELISGDTFNRHALTALKQLDAAVAAEVLDLKHIGDSGRKTPTDIKVLQSVNGETTSQVPPPPPPPPPPGWLFISVTCISLPEQNTN